ncbi:unnamed protein product [Urochloa humidicola]
MVAPVVAPTHPLLFSTPGVRCPPGLPSRPRRPRRPLYILPQPPRPTFQAQDAPPSPLRHIISISTPPLQLRRPAS